MSARTKAYNMQAKSIDKQYLFLGLDKGYRVDPVNHNFIILRNHLALGQSYFQLVVN